VLLAEICRDAGVPEGVVNVVTGPGADVGEALVADPDVRMVSFTGSTAVGRRVMQAAAATLKKVTLECGGKSANVVLDDASLDGAVRGAIFGAFFHSGQVCQAGTRLLVQRAVHDVFVEKLVAATRALRVGDPMDLETQLGPLISERQREHVERMVAIGLEEGAHLATGGRRPEHLARGFYYEPTIFTDVQNEMRIAREEIFGPVVVVIPFGGEEEAIRIANDSPYGLAAAVWSRDPARARFVADRIEAGTVWINDYHLLNVRFPFGGFKQSGFGRELGPDGLAEYEQLKHVHVGEPDDEKPYAGIVLD
jgi:aldehyde dehydrogenase (NAD+)